MCAYSDSSLLTAPGTRTLPIPFISSLNGRSNLSLPLRIILYLFRVTNPQHCVLSASCRGHEIILVSSGLRGSTNTLNTSTSVSNFHSFFEIARTVENASLARAQRILNLEQQGKTPRTAAAAKVSEKELKRDATNR